MLLFLGNYFYVMRRDQLFRRPLQHKNYLKELSVVLTIELTVLIAV